MKDKQCRACGKIKALDRFSPDKRATGGVRGTCKPCTAHRAKWRRANPGRAVAAEKACSSCERVLPADQFTPDAATSTGLGSHCRDCREARYYGRYRDRRPNSSDRARG